MLLTALAAGSGCEQLSTSGPSGGSASSPPPTMRALPESDDASAPPPSVAPALPSAAPPARKTAAEIAAELLPPPQPGLSPDIVRGDIVLRMLECYQTAAGITVTVAIVHVGDGDAETTLRVGDLMDDSQARFPPALTTVHGQVVPTEGLTLTLSLGVVSYLQALWINPRNQVLSGVRQFALFLSDSEQPAVFMRPTVSAPPVEPMLPDRIDAAVALLLAHCSPSNPGSAYWQKNQTTGRIAVLLEPISAEGGACEGEFFIPGDATLRKRFRLELSRDASSGDLQGTLETLAGSGPRGQPTRQPSTRNLLLRESVARYTVRLYGHELYGESEDGFRLSLTAAPPEPGLRLE